MKFCTDSELKSEEATLMMLKTRPLIFRQMGHNQFKQDALIYEITKRKTLYSTGKDGDIEPPQTPGLSLKQF